MHELRQVGGYGWGLGEMGVGLNVPGSQHRGSDMVSIFGRGSQVAPVYTPMGFWLLPPPPFPCVFLCVVAT